MHEMDVLPRQRRLALFNVIFDQIAELEPDHLAMPLARLVMSAVVSMCGAGTGPPSSSGIAVREPQA